jgi:glycosyltransferase involved in cell wall biosynthesis
LLGKSKLNFKWLYRGSLYFLRFSKLSPVQVTVEQYLRRYRVKIVLSEFLHASLKWLEVTQKLGLRFFAHAHGYDVSQTLRDPVMRRLYLRLEAADGIITMSEHSRNILIGLGLSGANIHVIPYGINVPDAPQNRQSDDSIRCLAVGRMVGKKAPTFTLEAFRRALSGNPHLRLDYIGDGDLFDEAKQFVQAHALCDKVVLHGSQPNDVVEDFMKNADIFLQHSRTDPATGDEEGLPVAILEAMANGLPVVSTRHAGIPEAVLDDVTGYLVDEGDIENMAVRIVQLANCAELRDQFGQAGWERAKQYFSWEREKTTLLKVLGL